MEDDDNDSQVKQAVDDEEAAEQPSIKINAQGLEADIRVREQEDLDTVLANLEFLARRNGFDTDLLGNRSVQEQEDGRVEQLNDVVTTVAENVQELDERVDRVEDELGGGEDSQLAEVIDRIQELEDSVQQLPEDVSRHLGELREEVKALEEYIDDVEEYATSVDDELESLRQKTSAREEEQESSETVESEDVDEETTTEETGEGRFTEEEIVEISRKERAEEIKPVIREKQPVDFEGICNEILGYKPDWDNDAYKAIHNAIQTFRGDLVTEKDGRSSLYAFSEEAFEDSPEQEDREGTEDSSEPEDDVDEEDEEEGEGEGEGLLRSVSAFNRLSKAQRENEIKQVIKEYEPIGTSEICEKLFGYEAKSGTDAYVAVQNAMQDFRNELEKEKDGRSTKYSFPEGQETEDQDTSISNEPESETVNGSKENDSPETQVPEEPEPSEPVESSDSDRPDFSDKGGRYSLEELRDDEDLSVEAEVLKVFQEYRKDCGEISIPEATQVLFGFEASEDDEEYQAVWNHLETYSRKDGDRVERIEKKDEKDRFKIFGPFKFCNLYYDTHHDVICTECPLEEAVYTARKAKKHHINTRNDGMKEHHNSFISAQIPDNFQNGETVHTIIERECGNQ
ncbi:hypothetical protein [Haloferax sp. Q22]|uniref:hypothetical protein n=1 Tax=Haloferax sp. (strain Q22) TaxID=1526048 RepID=UPI000737B452|nr:hypothetical protein [Haloferax sp. Q22]